MASISLDLLVASLAEVGTWPTDQVWGLGVRVAGDEAGKGVVTFVFRVMEVY